MKTAVVLITLVALVSFTGCGDKGSDKEGVKAPGPVASKLAFGLKAGDTLRYETNTKQSIAMPMGNQIQDITQENTWKVLAVDADGTATVEITIDVVKAHLENAMTGTTDFDSTAENAAEQANDPGLASFVALLGKSFQMKLTPRGKVVEVAGFYELMEAAMKDGMMWGMIKDAFSNKAMASNMQAGWCEFPDKDYAKGDTWTSTGKMTLPMMGDLTINNAYEIIDVVEGPEGTTVKIAFETVLDASSLKAPENSPIPMTMKDGTMKGTLEFDPIRGCVVGSDNSTSLTLEAMGMEVKTDIQQGLTLIK